MAIQQFNSPNWVRMGNTVFDKTKVDCFGVYEDSNEGNSLKIIFTSGATAIIEYPNLTCEEIHDSVIIVLEGTDFHPSNVKKVLEKEVQD